MRLSVSVIQIEERVERVERGGGCVEERMTEGERHGISVSASHVV